MADKRKLQGEIDRCLKRVSEGVEQFEDIWKKVHNAANANQKEKYEADLKKEIKKLQRLRDQIKTWLTSNDIKDKRPLTDARKVIETQMERFKVVERETKTKAYSKEGLGQVSKVDPEQRKKEEVRQWLTSSLDNLNMQIDEFESEIESIYAGSKKKKLDRDKNDRVEELQGWVERHKYHIKELETVMRMLDNCSLEPEKVKDIQDDLNYYIECNQEPDFAENELIYDDLDLDEAQTGMYSSSAVPIPHPVPPVEEEVNSIPSSPSACSQGPLSPKTPTTMKSTSQELFEERRRGKTTSVSSLEPSDMVAVPPSPRKPTPSMKPILPNSVVTATPAVVPAAATKPAPTHSSKPNSLPPAKPPSTTAAFSVSSSTPPPITSPPTTTPTMATGSITNGSQKTTPKLALSPWGQNSNSSPMSSQSPHSTASPTTVVLAQPQQHMGQPLPFSGSVSNTAVSTVGGSSLGHPHISTSSQPQLPRPQAPGSGHSQHSRSSSTSSSISSTTGLSQDSALQPHPQPHSMTAIAQSLTNSGPGHHISAIAASTAYETSTAAPAACGGSSGSTSSAQAHSQGSAPSSSGSPHVVMEADHTSPAVQPAPFSPGSIQPKQITTPPIPPSPSTSSLTSQSWMNPLETTTGLPPSSASHLPAASLPESSVFSGIMSWLPPTTSNSLLTSNEPTTIVPPSPSMATGLVTSSVGGGTSLGPDSSPPSSPFSSSLLTSATPPPTTTSSLPHSTLITMHAQAQLPAPQACAQPESTATSVNNDSHNQSTQQLASNHSSQLLQQSLPASQQELSSLKDIAAEVVASTSLSSQERNEPTDSIIRPLLDPSLTVSGERLENMSALSRTDTQLQPLLGVTPLGPMQLSQEKVYQLKMLEASCKHMPLPADSERVRPYLQRTPCPTPSFHHQHPPAHFDSFEFFQRLSIETLFFIFYYMEGTKAQYLAAKALKKLSWRFHTKYMMWFQRLEEPKAITDDYEMGTYIYFDFEKWSQRKKEGFTFEYRYLEDKDLP